MKKILFLSLTMFFIVASAHAYSPTYKDLAWGTKINPKGEAVFLEDTPWDGMGTYIVPDEKSFGRIPLETFGLIVNEDSYLIGVRFITRANGELIIDQFVNDYGYPEMDFWEEDDILYWNFPKTSIFIEVQDDCAVISFYDRSIF